MVIYFEDGSLTDGPVYSVTGDEIIKIEAGKGINANLNQLIAIEKERDFNTQVYTNSIVALWSTSQPER